MSIADRFGSVMGAFSAGGASNAAVDREAHVETAVAHRAAFGRRFLAPSIGASGVGPRFDAPAEAGGAPPPSQGREAHAETRRRRPLSADLLSALRAVAAHVANDENAERGLIGSPRKYLERIDSLGLRERNALSAVAEDDARAFINVARRYAVSQDTREQLGIPAEGYLGALADLRGEFGPSGPGPNLPGVPGEKYRDPATGIVFGGERQRPERGGPFSFGDLAGYGHHGAVTLGSGQSVGGGPDVPSAGRGSPFKSPLHAGMGYAAGEGGRGEFGTRSGVGGPSRAEAAGAIWHALHPGEGVTDNDPKKPDGGNDDSDKKPDETPPEEWKPSKTPGTPGWKHDSPVPSASAQKVGASVLAGAAIGALAGPAGALDGALAGLVVGLSLAKFHPKPFWLPPDDGTGPVGPWASTAAKARRAAMPNFAEAMPTPDGVGPNGPWATVGRRLGREAMPTDDNVGSPVGPRTSPEGISRRSITPNPEDPNGGGPSTPRS